MQVSQFQNSLFCLPPLGGTSGSNFNPPEADEYSKYFNVWMPVPLYLSGMVNPAMAGAPSLILNPAVSGKHFKTISTLSHYCKQSKLPYKIVCYLQHLYT